MFAVVKFPLKPILLSACVAVLAACGGGGGGGNESGGYTGQVGAISTGIVDLYSGSKTQPVLTETNALPAAKAALSALDLMFVTMPFATSVFELEFVEPSSETLAGELGGTVHITVTNSSGKVTITSEYDGYTTAEGSIDGTVEQVSTGESGNPLNAQIFSLEGSLTFDDLVIEIEDSSVRLNGTIESQLSTGVLLTANLLSEDLGDGSQLLLNGLSVDIKNNSDANDPGARIDSFSLKGQLYDSALGLLQVKTTRPLQAYGWSEVDGLFAGGGGSELAVSGSQNEVTFSGLNRQFAAVTIAFDDQGNPPKFQRVTWSEINGDSEVFILGNTSAPVANLGIAFTSNVGATTLVHGLFSHDVDRDFLEYDWNVVAVPSGSFVAEKIDLQKSILEFVPDVEGDYLFSLQVRDGFSSAKVSTKVTVNHASFFRDTDLYYSPVGGIEIFLNDVGTQSLTASADSVIPYTPADLENQIGWEVGNGYSIDANFNVGLDPLTIGAANEFINNQMCRVSFIKYFDESDPLIELLFSVDKSVPDLFSVSPLEIQSEEIQDVRDMISADLNGDGVDDLIVGHSESLSIYYRRDDALELNQTLVLGDSSDYIFFDGQLLLADLSSDGFKDLVIPTYSGYFIAKQNADRTFAQPVFLSMGSLPCDDYSSTETYSAQVGDYNGDGLNDLFADVECSGNDYVVGQALFLGQLDGTLDQPTLLPYFGAYVVELTGDERTDLVVSSRNFDSSSITLAVYENLESGLQLLFENSVGQTLGWDVRVIPVDFNEDGVLDFLQVTDSEVLMYARDDGNSFTLVATLDSGAFGIASTGGSAYVGDFDNNGEADIMLARTDNNHEIELILQENGVYRITSFPLPSNARQFDVKDVNNDGYADIIARSLGEEFIYYGGQKVYSVVHQ
ncbi:FG-GAP repeat domain-containing protein [Halioxenophilus aromaticivorans]|uniref:VCBS repeat-containing protein n=1 Tax=Halioxenophilus aromaticivorans TaxID=1306992 RepID=A0AAV3U4U8_9ALTE